MLDWDMNHHLLQKFIDNYFPHTSTMMHETWIGNRKKSNYDNFLYVP
jgi:hypothetical protein